MGMERHASIPALVKCYNLTRATTYNTTALVAAAQRNRMTADTTIFHHST